MYSRDIQLMFFFLKCSVVVVYAECVCLMMTHYCYANHLCKGLTEEISIVAFASAKQEYLLCIWYIGLWALTCLWNTRISRMRNNVYIDFHERTWDIMTYFSRCKGICFYGEVPMRSMVGPSALFIIIANARRMGTCFLVEGIGNLVGVSYNFIQEWSTMFQHVLWWALQHWEHVAACREWAFVIVVVSMYTPIFIAIFKIL